MVVFSSGALVASPGKDTTRRRDVAASPSLPPVRFPVRLVPTGRFGLHPPLLPFRPNLGRQARMGCGSSVQKHKLDEAEQRLEEERKRSQEREAQFARVEEARILQEQSARATRELETELQARQLEHLESLQQQREELRAEHHAELRRCREEQDETLRRELGKLAEQARQEARAERDSAEESHRGIVTRLEADAEAEAERHRQDAAGVNEEICRLREQLGPMRREYELEAEALREARSKLQAEHEERLSSTSRTAALEMRLREAEGEHTRSEQRYEDLDKHLRAQVRDLQEELRSQATQLHEKSGALQVRDQEVAEVNAQLADLQGLFDEVNHQLQAECGRIEKLQDTVALCARQSKELETLQGMLEESHRMLAQVRDALEAERGERTRIAGLLEHEQQRTKLLLDVLKHFKEKLQGLTPQMILSRIGCSDPKALLAGGVPLAGLAGLPGLAGLAATSVDHSCGKSALTSSGASAISPCPPPPGHATGVDDAKSYGLGSPRCGTSDGAASTAAPPDAAAGAAMSAALAAPAHAMLKGGGDGGGGAWAVAPGQPGFPSPLPAMWQLQSHPEFSPGAGSLHAVAGNTAIAASNDSGD